MKTDEFNQTIVDSLNIEDGESIVLEVSFFTQEYSLSPVGVRIQLKEIDIKNILEALSFMRDKDSFWSINVRCYSDVIFLKDIDTMEIDEDWRSDVMQFQVYKDSVYFFAQNKWDGRDQIETESFIVK